MVSIASSKKDSYTFGLAMQYYAEIRSGKQFVKGK